MLLYRLLHSTITDESGGKVRVFGVRGPTLFFPDVTTDKTKMKSQIRKYNSLGLEECHLKDVLLDFIVNSDL